MKHQEDEEAQAAAVQGSLADSQGNSLVAPSQLSRPSLAGAPSANAAEIRMPTETMDIEQQESVVPPIHHIHGNPSTSGLRMISFHSTVCIAIYIYIESLK